MVVGGWSYGRAPGRVVAETAGRRRGGGVGRRRRRTRRRRRWGRDQSDCGQRQVQDEGRCALCTATCCCVAVYTAQPLSSTWTDCRQRQDMVRHRGRRHLGTSPCRCSPPPHSRIGCQPSASQSQSRFQLPVVLSVLVPCFALQHFSRVQASRPNTHRLHRLLHSTCHLSRPMSAATTCASSVMFL
jgi:hypothetical protein